MAQIDFSNAVIDISPLVSSNARVLSAPYFTSNGNGYMYWRESSSSSVTLVSEATIQLLEKSLYKLSYLVTGEITGQGLSNVTWFDFWNSIWRVSNIQYSSGDTYSFQVDFDITVS